MKIHIKTWGIMRSEGFPITIHPDKKIDVNFAIVPKLYYSSRSYTQVSIKYKGFLVPLNYCIPYNIAYDRELRVYDMLKMIQAYMHRRKVSIEKICLDFQIPNRKIKNLNSFDYENFETVANIVQEPKVMILNENENVKFDYKKVLRSYSKKIECLIFLREVDPTHISIYNCSYNNELNIYGLSFNMKNVNTITRFTKDNYFYHYQIHGEKTGKVIPYIEPNNGFLEMHYEDLISSSRKFKDSEGGEVYLSLKEVEGDEKKRYKKFWTGKMVEKIFQKRVLPVVRFIQNCITFFIDLLVPLIYLMNSTLPRTLKISRYENYETTEPKFPIGRKFQCFFKRILENKKLSNEYPFEKKAQVENSSIFKVLYVNFFKAFFILKNRLAFHLYFINATGHFLLFLLFFLRILIEKYISFFDRTLELYNNELFTELLNFQAPKTKANSLRLIIAEKLSHFIFSNVYRLYFIGLIILKFFKVENIQSKTVINTFEWLYFFLRSLLTIRTAKQIYFRDFSIRNYIGVFFNAPTYIFYFITSLNIHTLTLHFLDILQPILLKNKQFVTNIPNPLTPALSILYLFVVKFNIELSTTVILPTLSVFYKNSNVIEIFKPASTFKFLAIAYICLVYILSKKI